MLQSKIAQFNIKLVSFCWYSVKGLTAAENVFEKSIQLIQNENQKTGTFSMINNIRGQDVYSSSIKNLDLKKEQYGYGLGFCKKALNLAIENKSCQAFEELLQHFIKAQTNNQDETAIDRYNEMFNESGTFNIANPYQHKGKGRPANKRYLSAIENHSGSRSSDIQEETSDARRKKNKRQCSICKSWRWYHDSQNCPKKNKEVNVEDKEND